MIRQVFDCLDHAVNRIVGHSYPVAADTRSLQPILKQKRPVPPIEGECLSKRMCVRSDSTQDLHISHPLADIVSPNLMREWGNARRDSEMIKFQVGEKVTPEHAPIDAWIVKAMQGPEGPKIAESIKQSAIENKEDVFGLAREACRVMGGQVDNDICLLSTAGKLTVEGKNILENLRGELIKFSKQECVYSKWIELTARYTKITGWAYYLASPDDFDILMENRKKPEFIKEVADYRWSEIIECLSNTDYQYICRQPKSWMPDCTEELFFEVNEPRYISKLKENGAYALPTFQVLGLKELNFNHYQKSKYCGVLLVGGAKADGLKLTRADFYDHDIAHCRDAVVYEYWERHPVDLRHKLMTVLYKKQGEVDEMGAHLKGSLFKAVEMIVFTSVHEFAKQIEDAIYLEELNKVIKYIVKSFKDKTFENLEDEYGHCIDRRESTVKESETLIFAKDILKQLRQRLSVSVEGIRSEDFEKALQSVIQEQKATLP